MLHTLQAVSELDINKSFVFLDIRIVLKILLVTDTKNKLLCALFMSLRLKEITTESVVKAILGLRFI